MSFLDILSEKPDWVRSDTMHVFIFNIGRGLSIFIRTPTNHGIIYDLGSSVDFSPLEFLKGHILPHLDKYNDNAIAQMIISHPHGDHITEIEKVCKAERDGVVYPYYLTCPHDKDGTTNSEKVDWDRITNRESESNLLECYKNLLDGREPPLRSLSNESGLTVENFEYGIFYVRPPYVGNILHPADDQKYSNGISLITYFKYGAHSILLPGDVSPESMAHILEEGNGMEKRYTAFGSYEMEDNEEWTQENATQPSLKTLLDNHGLSILLAPHHGLESGYSTDLYSSMRNERPHLVIISEKRHTGENDGSVDPRYQRDTGALGLTINIDGKDEDHRSISTRNNHHILIKFHPDTDDPDVILRSDAEDLITEM